MAGFYDFFFGGQGAPQREERKEPRMPPLTYEEGLALDFAANPANRMTTADDAHFGYMYRGAPSSLDEAVRDLVATGRRSTNVEDRRGYGTPQAPTIPLDQARVDLGLAWDEYFDNPQFQKDFRPAYVAQWQSPEVKSYPSGDPNSPQGTYPVAATQWKLVPGITGDGRAIFDVSDQIKDYDRTGGHYGTYTNYDDLAAAYARIVAQFEAAKKAQEERRRRSMTQRQQTQNAGADAFRNSIMRTIGDPRYH